MGIGSSTPFTPPGLSEQLDEATNGAFSQLPATVINALDDGIKELLSWIGCDDGEDNLKAQMARRPLNDLKSIMNVLEQEIQARKVVSPLPAGAVGYTAGAIIPDGSYGYSVEAQKTRCETGGSAGDDWQAEICQLCDYFMSSLAKSEFLADMTVEDINTLVFRECIPAFQRERARQSVACEKGLYDGGRTREAAIYYSPTGWAPHPDLEVCIRQAGAGEAYLQRWQSEHTPTGMEGACKVFGALLHVFGAIMKGVADVFLVPWYVISYNKSLPGEVRETYLWSILIGALDVVTMGYTMGAGVATKIALMSAKATAKAATWTARGLAVGARLGRIPARLAASAARVAATLSRIGPEALSKFPKIRGALLVPKMVADLAVDWAMADFLVGILRAQYQDDNRYLIPFYALFGERYIDAFDMIQAGYQPTMPRLLKTQLHVLQQEQERAVKEKLEDEAKKLEEAIQKLVQEVAAQKKKIIKDFVKDYQQAHSELGGGVAGQVAALAVYIEQTGGIGALRPQMLTGLPALLLLLAVAKGILPLSLVLQSLSLQGLGITSFDRLEWWLFAAVVVVLLLVAWGAALDDSAAKPLRPDILCFGGECMTRRVWQALQGR